MWVGVEARAGGLGGLAASGPGGQLARSAMSAAGQSAGFAGLKFLFLSQIGCFLPFILFPTFFLLFSSVCETEIYVMKVM